MWGEEGKGALELAARSVQNWANWRHGRVDRDVVRMLLERKLLLVAHLES